MSWVTYDCALFTLQVCITLFCFSVTKFCCLYYWIGLRLTQTWNCGESPGRHLMAYSGRGQWVPAWPRPPPLTQQTPWMVSRSIPNSLCLPSALSRRLTSAASTATRSHTRTIQHWSSGWWWRRAALTSFWSSRRANCSWPMLRLSNKALLLMCFYVLDLLIQG